MGESGGERAALSTVFPHGPQDTIHSLSLMNMLPISFKIELLKT